MILATSITAIIQTIHLLVLPPEDVQMPLTDVAQNCPYGAVLSRCRKADAVDKVEAWRLPGQHSLLSVHVSQAQLQVEAVPTQPERDWNVAVEDGRSVDLEKRSWGEDVSHPRLGVVTAADVDQLRVVIDVALFKDMIRCKIKHVNSCIAQYLVFRIAQNSVQFSSLADLYNQTLSQLLMEAFSHAAINARTLLVHI